MGVTYHCYEYIRVPRAINELLAIDIQGTLARITREEFHECANQFCIPGKVMVNVGESLRVLASVHE